MSVLEELLEDSQPGYEASVVLLINRLRHHLGDAAFSGVEKTQVILRAVETMAGSGLAPDTIAQLMADISMLSWWCGMEMDDEAAAAVANLARKTFYDSAQIIRLRIDKADPKAMRSHVVFIGQVISRLHSPTQGAFQYVRALASDPETTDVEVFYCHAMTEELEAYKQATLGEHLRKVKFTSIDTNPDFLLMAIENRTCTYHIWCEAPIASHISLVAIFGPTIMFTCGDAAPVQFADVYWYCQDKPYIEKLWTRRGAPQSFIANYRTTESAPFPPIPAQSKRTRAQLGFGPDEIVMVTVGNRLAIDMTQPFVDGMGALMLSDPRLRWVMVGQLQDYWINAFSQVLGSQFTHLTADGDLGSLFAEADIFVNPFRSGGGNSALMAVESGSLVLTRGGMGDVRAFIPTAHHAADAEDFFVQLAQLVDDPALRAARLAEQRALLARRLDQALFAKELKQHVSIAFGRFAARIPASLEEIFAQPRSKAEALRISGRKRRLR